MPSLRPAVRLTLAVIASLAVSVRARADDAPLRAPVLTWVAPPGCPSEAELTRQVLATMGAGVDVPGSLRARAVVDEVQGRWRSDVELSVEGETTVRHVDGETCRAVADAVALIVALAVAPEPRRPEPPPPSALAPAPLPPPPLPSRPASSAERPLPYDVGATFLLDGGTLPGVGYGVELVAGWRRSRFELELAARFLAPEAGDLSPGPAGTVQGAHFSMVGGGIRGCYALVTGTFDIAPCVGAQGEWMVARGFDATVADFTRTAGTPALSIGGRITARVAPWLSLRLGGEAEAPLVRTQFDFNQGATVLGTVFRRSAVAGRGFVGPLLLF